MRQSQRKGEEEVEAVDEATRGMASGKESTGRMLAEIELNGK